LLWFSLLWFSPRSREIRLEEIMRKCSGNPSHRGVWQLVAVLGCLFVAALVVVACSSTTPTSGSGMGKVSVLLSDPATCQAPNGPYQSVWVTVTDVQANMSSTAGPTDSGWVDLTPNLTPTPVDLLGPAVDGCFLAQLGDALELQAGTYQQIRVKLAPNSGKSYNSNCSNANNCVVLSSDTSTSYPLLLSSEAQTGIKIPASQISGGGVTIAAGQTRDLDIDFNTCVSILKEGNGQYRLKPVLHAGVVSLTSNSINGTVVDASTENPVAGMVTVTLEQKDANGIDRIIVPPTLITVNADGTFVICPVTEGDTNSTYDVVVTGVEADGKTMYAPSIVTGVSPGSTVGTIKLNPPTAALATASSATLTGAVNSVSGSANTSTGVAVDVVASALEQVNSTWYTIPLPMVTGQTSSQLALTTAANSTTNPCTPTSAYCANYTMILPSSGAYIGSWSSSGTTLSEPALLATYETDAIASNTSTGELDCSVSDQQSTPTTQLTGTGPFTATVPTITFLSCN
jgi:Domain of unknown function (DUF4382)